METQFNKEKFDRVAVLMGGNSAEREVSLKSGNAILGALQRLGVDVIAIDVKDNVVEQLQSVAINVAFIALHGRGGEDGTIQGLLEMLNIPYTGSGVMASALAMDKMRSKQLWQGCGLSTPTFKVLTDETDWEQVVSDLGLPLMIKPVHEGSSIGMHKVNSVSELSSAYHDAVRFDFEVIAEQWVEGTEYTVAILNNRALPVIGLVTSNDFYDYDAKYKTGNTEYKFPSGLTQSDEIEIQQLAMDAFKALGCHGWGRVDFIQDHNANNWLLEVNTVPGMTEHSLVPKAAQANSMRFDDLVMQILETVSYD